MTRPHKSLLDELADSMGPSSAISHRAARQRAIGGNVVRLVPKPAGKSMAISDRTFEKMMGRRNQRLPQPFFPDAARLHPPGTAPKGKALAMDSALAWAGDAWTAGAAQSAFLEGQEFLGYPYLAVLAQRPEYRAIIETIATEATRKWIKLQSSDTDDDKTDKIKELTNYLDDLKLREHFGAISQQGNYFGRAHLYVDLGTTDDRDELMRPIGDGRSKISRLKVPKGAKLEFRPVEAWTCYPSDYNSSDPLKPEWYTPQTWLVMGKSLHVSRLLWFVPHPVPDLLKPAYSFGGVSMTQMAKPYVDNWLRTRQSVADIIQAFSVMVLSTDMSGLEGLDGDTMVKRAVMFNALRQNNGLMMVNKDTEEFANVAAPLGTLDQLQAQAQEHMAAVGKIPTVKLLGIQPAGLNADSEGILRAFDDTIHAYQEDHFRPHLTTCIHFAQLALWGEVDESITFEFPRLREMDEKEKAEINKIEAETDVILVEGAIIHPEEARKRVGGDPDTAYPGLDVDDIPEPPQEGIGEGEGGEGGLQPPKLKTSINVAGGDDAAVPALAPNAGVPAVRRRLAGDAGFEESEHPRDDDGKFAESAGGGKFKSEGSGGAVSSQKKLGFKSIDDFLKENGINFTKEGSTSFSEMHGQSPSQYYKIQTPDGPQTIRISNHSYGGGKFDLRYGDDTAPWFRAILREMGMDYPLKTEIEAARRELVEAEDRLRSHGDELRRLEKAGVAKKEKTSIRRQIETARKDIEAAAAKYSELNAAPFEDQNDAKATYNPATPAVRRKIAGDADGFEEADHPRGKGGKFTSGPAHVVTRMTESGKPKVVGVHAGMESAAAQQNQVLKSKWDKEQREMSDDPEDWEPYPGTAAGWKEANKNAAGEVVGMEDFPHIHATETKVSPGQAMHVVASGTHDPEGSEAGPARVHGVFDNPEAAAKAADKIARQQWEEGKGALAGSDDDEWAAIQAKVVDEWNNAHPDAEPIDAESISYTTAGGWHEQFLDDDDKVVEKPLLPELAAAIAAIEEQPLPYPGLKKAIGYWREQGESDALIPVITKAVVAGNAS